MSAIGALAAAMRSIRAAQGVTQLSLALAMGASSTSYLSKLESGRCRNPSRAFIRMYVATYGLLSRPLSESQLAQLYAALLDLDEAA